MSIYHLIPTHTHTRWNSNDIFLLSSVLIFLSVLHIIRRDNFVGCCFILIIFHTGNIRWWLMRVVNVKNFSSYGIFLHHSVYYFQLQELLLVVGGVFCYVRVLLARRWSHTQFLTVWYDVVWAISTKKKQHASFLT